jgi:hypothetical protein
MKAFYDDEGDALQIHFTEPREQVTPKMSTEPPVSSTSTTTRKRSVWSCSGPASTWGCSKRLR